MWDLIVSVHDHCLSFYFFYFKSSDFKIKINVQTWASLLTGIVRLHQTLKKFPLHDFYN